MRSPTTEVDERVLLLIACVTCHGPNRNEIHIERCMSAYEAEQRLQQDNMQKKKRPRNIHSDKIDKSGEREQQKQPFRRYGVCRSATAGFGLK